MAQSEQTIAERRRRESLAALLLLRGRTRAQLQRDGIQFIFDPAGHRYWNISTEQLVRPAELRVFVDSAISNTGKRIATLTQSFIDGKISFAEWRTVSQAELKAMHTGLSQIAIGGRSEWTASTAGRLGARLRMLYDKLNGLGLERERGLVSDAELLNRMGMATQAGRGTYEGMVRGSMMNAGYDMEMRILNAANHCGDCPPLSGYWAPIGTLPELGSTACLSNCACTWDFMRTGDLISHRAEFEGGGSRELAMAAD